MTGPLLSPLSRDRLAGARAAARGRGCEQDLIVMQGDFSIRSGAEAADALLKRPDRPTAVFCFNDEMAMGVIGAARRRGLRIPDDLSVVGFDDIRFAQCVDPPLTTIAQPMRAIGEGTVRLLLEILQGRRVTPVSVTLPHKLQVRASTAPRPSRKSEVLKAEVNAEIQTQRSAFACADLVQPITSSYNLRLKPHYSLYRLYVAG